MSDVHEAIAWAIKVSKGEPMPARMLLIVGLAQRVGRKSDDAAWPSVRQLGEDTDMSPSSVRRWMKHLESEGLVVRNTRKSDSGRQTSNSYYLPIKSVFYHPKKGAIAEIEEGSQSDRVGVNLTGGGSHSGDRVTLSPGDTPYELPEEIPIELNTVTREDEFELPLGLEPLPPKDPTPAEVASFFEEEWAARDFVTPLRGDHLSAANAEKARDLGRDAAVGNQNAIDVWREVFSVIDGSDFLQGKATSQGRAPLRLSISFILEKRNFIKALEGRFNGKAQPAERKYGTTTLATASALEILHARDQRSAGRNHQGGDDGRGEALRIAGPR